MWLEMRAARRKAPEGGQRGELQGDLDGTCLPSWAVTRVVAMLSLSLGLLEKKLARAGVGGEGE